MKPTLYIMCGPSGCGKTTFANTLIQHNDTRYVSRDEIRFSMLKSEEDYFAHEKEVFKKFSDTIRATLVDGFDVIADATHLNYSSRRKLITAIDKCFTDYNIVYVVFDKSLETCLKLNENRVGREHVPASAIRNMYSIFCKPTLDEDNRAIGMITIQGEVFNE